MSDASTQGDMQGSSLLVFDVEERRRAVGPGGGLKALADGLAAELEPLIAGALPIPAAKARLTRGGGRCPVHGDLLEFDPYQAEVHHCTRCAHDYSGADHDSWWAMGAGLWTMERAVHAAALFLLRGDPRHASLSSRILSEFAARYRQWPNADNVLGPSRPFFSTYLESIWLLNACHALSLLQAAEAPELATLERVVIPGLILPSSRLVSGFHEGMSNRQVWNEVAVLSALTVSGDDAGVAARLDRDDGLLALFDDGLLADGTWYEGENYHMFAHRGLWYGAELLRARAAQAGGADENDGDEGSSDVDGLSPSMQARYREGFVTPFLGMLPDDTLPSRRDSRYAVSIHQWRTAEWCELGYATTGDPRVAGVLTRIYDRLPAAAESGLQQRTAREAATGRSRSTADAERDAPPEALDRGSLSWRGLLCASADAPPPSPWKTGSVCLPLQGLAAIRRDRGNTYVALEGGHTGGDHGHPDRLALTLQSGAHRWLDDPGTGSYVDRSLHWYRSTLAHAAPLVDGASQQRRPASLLAFEDRGGAGWISKRVDAIAPGVTCVRSVVVCDGYLVDLLEWRSDEQHEISLPVAARADGVAAAGARMQFAPSRAAGAGGLEDGFDFAEDVESATLAAGATLTMNALAGGRLAQLWYVVRTDASDSATLFRATVPGVPGAGRTQRHWLSVHGSTGYIAGVCAWPDPESGATGVTQVHFAESDPLSVTVHTADGTSAQHIRLGESWRIDLLVGDARSSIDMDTLESAGPDGAMHRLHLGDEGETDGAILDEVDADQGDAVDESAAEPLFADYDVPYTDERTDQLRSRVPGDEIDDALPIPLGAAHYRGTEQSFKDAGEPTAMLQLTRNDTHFVLDVIAFTGEVVVPTPDVTGALVNPLDNERADVNADGLQWYIGRTGASAWAAGGLIVPTAASADAPDVARAHALVAGATATPDVGWTTTDDGWAMRLCWRLESLPVDVDGCIAFDVIVNERPADRERRRGQLVLSGGDGFAYLRGDRHDPRRAVVIGVT